MASKQANVDFVLEQMGGAAEVSARKMFGEYAIYSRGKIVALFCDDELFVKPTVGGKAFIGDVKEGAPYPGAKAWYVITGDVCEDGDWLSELIRITERELPIPKPKAKKASAKKASAKKANAKKASAKKANAKKVRAKATARGKSKTKVQAKTKSTARARR
jgi:TfoX/Sxy family transcriptional regulator of competence genes